MVTLLNLAINLHLVSPKPPRITSTSRHLARDARLALTSQIRHCRGPRG